MNKDTVKAAQMLRDFINDTLQLTKPYLKSEVLQCVDVLAEQYMIDNYPPKYADPIGHWHKIFACIPINTLDEGWKWLCFVQRRRTQKHDWLSGGPDLFWQYLSLTAITSHPPKS